MRRKKVFMFLKLQDVEMSMMTPPDPTMASSGGCDKHDWVDDGPDKRVCRICKMVCEIHDRRVWNGGQFCSVCGKLWPKNL